MKFQSKTTRTLSFFSCMMLILISVAGCDLLNSDPDDDGEKVTLNLRLPDSGDGISPKTILQNDKKVIWEENDSVNINGIIYKVIPDDSDPSLGTIEDVEKDDAYVATYPAFHNNFSGNDAYLCVQPAQKYKKGTFAQDYNPMLAYSQDTDLYFKNVGGVLKIGLKAKEGSHSISSVTVSSNDGQSVSGWLVYGSDQLMQDDFDSPSLVPGNIYDDVSMFFDEPLVIDDSSTEYLYVVVIPEDIPNGINVTVTDEDGKFFVESMSGNIPVERSGITTIETILYAPSENLDAQLGTTAYHDRIEFSVQGPENMAFKVGVFSSYLRSYFGDENYTAFLNEALYSFPVNVMTSGPMNFSESSATYMGGEKPVFESYDYDVVVAACNEVTGDIVGTPIILPATTATVTDGAPSVEVIPDDANSTHSKLTFNLIGTGVYKTYVSLLFKDSYDATLANGLSERKIAIEYGEFFDAAWDTGNSVAKSFDNLKPATEYTFLCFAISASGASSVSVASVATKNELDITDWETVSTSSVFDCGIFNAVLGTGFTLQNITVEKAAGKDVFRLVNPFDINNNPQLASYFTALPGDYYVNINAEDPNAVFVEMYINKLGVEMIGDDGSYGDIGTFSVGLVDNSVALGTYDKENGIIYLGELGLETTSSFYYGGESVVYLNGTANVPAHGNTEDFHPVSVIEW